jgi:uncharacterized BrkB/YihY/UPF0761 family membrane protein
MAGQSTSRLRAIPRELIALYWESGVADDVPAMAWFLLSSLVPLALGLTALAAVLLGDYAQAQALSARLSRVLPKDVHDQIVQLILRTKRDSPLLITGSIIAMVWVCSGAVGVLSRCLSRLLGRSGVGLVIGKLRNLGVAAAVTTMIVVMVIVASSGTGLVERLHVNPTLIRVAVALASAAAIVAICAIVLRVLGGDSLRWRAALAGGAISGVILWLTPTVAGYYLRFVAGRTPVELFLMLTGVLITCYVAALGLLLGAAFAARLQLGERLGAADERPAITAPAGTGRSARDRRRAKHRPSP